MKNLAFPETQPPARNLYEISYDATVFGARHLSHRGRRPAMCVSRQTLAGASQQRNRMEYFVGVVVPSADIRSMLNINERST